MKMIEEHMKDIKGITIREGIIKRPFNYQGLDAELIDPLLQASLTRAVELNCYVYNTFWKTWTKLFTLMVFIKIYGLSDNTDKLIDNHA